MLYKKVDYVVTDSPVLMGTYCAQLFCPQSVSEGVRACSLAFYRQAAEDGHRHVHIFLNRTKPYVAAGSYQSESEAKDVDVGVQRLLTDLKFPIIECTTDEDNLRNLLVNMQAQSK